MLYLEARIGHAADSGMLQMLERTYTAWIPLSHLDCQRHCSCNQLQASAARRVLLSSETFKLWFMAGMRPGRHPAEGGGWAGGYRLCRGTHGLPACRGGAMHADEESPHHERGKLLEGRHAPGKAACI